MNRITTTSEYLLVFLVILEFNTPYSIIPFVKVIYNAFPLCILFILILLSIKKLVIKDFACISIYYVGSIFPLLSLSDHAYLAYLRVYILMLPMLWMYLNIKRKKGMDAYHSLFIKYSNIVVCIAAVSLIMWLLESILHITSPTTQIPNDWTMDGSIRLIPTYYGIYFETQQFSIFGIEACRNTGIFNEGPMYNMILCTALLIECFVRTNISKKRIILLILTIISTATTTGQMFLLMLAFVWIYKNMSQKSKIVLWVTAPFVLYGIYKVANIILEEKYAYGAGASSMDIRSGSIMGCINIGLEHPIFGIGLFPKKLVYPSLILDHSNSLFELFAVGGLYVLALYISSLLFIPYFYYKEKKNVHLLFVMWGFFMLFSFTSSQYKYLTLLFVAWGLSHINLKFLATNKCKQSKNGY